MSAHLRDLRVNSTSSEILSASVSPSSNDSLSMPKDKKNLPKKIKQQATERLFKKIFIIYFILIWPLLYNTYDFNYVYVPEEFKNEPQMLYEAWRFDIFFIALFTETVIRILAGKLFFKTALNLMEEKPPGWDREFTAEKMCKWTCDFFYYIGISIAEIILLNDSNWIPKELFGSANYADMKYMDKWPRSVAIEFPYINHIYSVQLAHHTYTLGYQLLFQYGRDPKFWEYFLHHFLAHSLILFSLCMRCQPPGIFILLTHDIGDGLLALGRAYSEFKNKTRMLGYPVMFMAIVSWVYCRCYIYTPVSLREIHTMFLTNEYPIAKDLYRFGYGFSYLASMILLLIPMSFYWIYYMFKYALCVFLEKRAHNFYEHRDEELYTKRASKYFHSFGTDKLQSNSRTHKTN